MCNDGKHVRIKCKYFTWSAAYIRFVILRYGCSTVYFSTKFKDFKIWVSMQQDWTCNSVGFRKLNSGATLCAKHWTVWSTWWWILLYVNILGDVTCVLMSELFFGWVGGLWRKYQRGGEECCSWKGTDEAEKSLYSSCSSSFPSQCCRHLWFRLNWR